MKGTATEYDHFFFLKLVAETPEEACLLMRLAMGYRKKSVEISALFSEDNPLSAEIRAAKKDFQEWT